MAPKVISFILIVFTQVVQVSYAQTDSYKNVYTESAWKERDAWQKPGEIIRKMKIDTTSVVADIGCHEGYMTFKLANAAGRVYAVDVDQGKLNAMKRYIEKSKVSNVITVKGDYDNPKLPDNTLDAVVILDTYHEMDDHDEILQHIMTALKKGGRLVICEPIADSRRKLARADQEKKHELAMNFALEDLAKAGFTIQEKTDPFVNREKVKGDKMWIIVAVK
jgi:ubiquinone/menaquinone biosynthesis C-methylase UbiE